MSGPTAETDGSLRVFGMWLSRHSAMYVLAAVITLVLSLAQVAVTTRFLDPTEFGQAALLFFFAALLTILYNLATLQGTYMRAFGSAEDEDIDVDPDQPPIDDAQKRRALGNGIALTASSALVGTVVSVALAPGIADLLLGGEGSRDLVLLAAASGAFGALWRLLQNIPRLEIKPPIYVALSAVRPVLVMAIAIPLVATGHGVGGLVGGTALGTALAVLVAIFVCRKSYRLGLTIEESKAIVRRGASYVPITLSFWIVGQGDLFALSRYALTADVGLYRLASRLGAFANYTTGAMMQAWAPLRRTEMHAVAFDEYGMKVGGTMVTYYCLLSFGILLGMTIGADALVQIAPPAYAGAAPLIPLTAAGFLMNGLLIVIQRSSAIPRKRNWYVGCAVGSAITFVAIVPFLTSRFGAYGTAASTILAFALGSAVMFTRSQRSQNPLDISYRQLAAVVLVTAACLGLAGASRLAGDVGPLIELAVLLCFPWLLIVSGAIPRAQAKTLLTIVRGTFGRRPDELDPVGLERAAQRKKLDPLEEETARDERVHYYLHIGPWARSDVLVMSFSSALPKMPPAYSYVPPLRATGCGVLFLRTAGGFYGLHGSTGEDSVRELLESVVRERGIERERVICVGSGQGGGVALSQAAGCGFGHAVVASPVILLGEAFLGEQSGKRGRAIAESLAGSSDDAARERLNAIVPDLLRSAESPAIHLLTSEDDPFHASNHPALVAACDANRRISLEVTTADYTEVRGIRRAFPDFLTGRIKEIVRSLPKGS